MAVYLDHAATTPLHPAARAAFVDALSVVGNPSSIHAAGQGAKRMLEEARERVASALGCEPIEVVFTSGGTESVNLGVKGLYWARNRDTRRPRIVVPAGEHHATIDTVDWLVEREGAVLDEVPLDAEGRIRVDALADVLARDPASVALVTVLHANNEVGTIQPLRRIAELCLAAGAPLHVDAVSSFGHLPIAVRELPGLSALSVSAHKIGGPVGIGALVVRRTADVEALVHGGGQQRRVRSGTQDVAGAVAFAAAADAVTAAMAAEGARVTALRDRLLDGVARLAPGAVVNGVGPGAERLPGNAHLSFPGCEGDSLLFLLDAAGVAVSTGSACQAGIPEPSHVLRAMGRSDAEARGALRVTLGATSTGADVDAFLRALPDAVERAARAGLANRAPSGTA